MHIKSLILGSVVAVALAGAFTSGAQAQTSGYCFTKARNGDVIDPPMCGTAAASNGGSGENINWSHHYPPVAAVVPVLVDPVVPPVVVTPDPVEHPAHPGEPGTVVSLIGTVFEGFPPGTYTQIFAPIIPEYGFPGGVVDAVIFEDGTAYVWVISLGLPGLDS